MSKKEVESHAMLVGGFSPYTSAHHENVKQMQKGDHTSVNVFATQSSRRPISAEKKIDYIKTAVGKGVNVGTTQTPLHAASKMYSSGKRGKLVVYGGSDRSEIADTVKKYNGVESKHGYYNFNKIEFRQVGGERKEGAKGMAGISGTAARKAKNPEELKKFIPKELHHRADEIYKDLKEETMNPVGIFLIGGPGSGKDYVLKNIFSRFDFTEVQSDQLINGAANELHENNQNLIINGALDEEKISLIKTILEGYTFDYVYVSVTNTVSRNRNAARDVPLQEQKRLEKWYKADKLSKSYDCFTFNNSINLQESSEFEKVFFGSQIEKLLERITNLGLDILEKPEPKTFMVIREELKYKRRIPRSGNITAVKARQKENLATADATQKALNQINTTAMQREETKMPDKYKTGNPKTDKARAAHWKKMSKYSDRDPRAYKDAPGDKKAREEGIPLSPHTVAVRKMMAKEEVVAEGAADSSLAAKAQKSGISVGTLRKVYKRGVAAWNSGHRPGTTPQQWGHARVNSYINKGKTYHTADKDLHSEGADYFEFRRNQDSEKAHRQEVITNAKNKLEDIDTLFERQLVGTDEYRRHAIAMTPGQNQEIEDATKKFVKPFTVKKEETNDELADCCGGSDSERSGISFRNLRSKITEAEESKVEINTEPKLETDPKKTKKKKGSKNAPADYNSTVDGMPVTGNPLAEAKSDKGFMPTPRQVPAPKGGHPVPVGYERVKSWGGAWELRKIKEKPTTVKEAVEYHIENQISFTDNAFRPGSDMFFEMIEEAKKLYKEGKYTPADEFELDMLNSNIGEKAMFEGKEVILDYPFEEELNEEDKTGGKGIGKPWREGGGGAVYVRDGDSIRKIRFSQSGMKKKYMDPAATRSFVARHHCLTNKNKASASYWACRWPRFFSNSGKIWW